MITLLCFFFFFFFNDTAPTEIYTLSLHDALPISAACDCKVVPDACHWRKRRLHDISRPQCRAVDMERSEEHTSELQSQSNLVCRLLLEKKKKKQLYINTNDQTTYEDTCHHD